MGEQVIQQRKAIVVFDTKFGNTERVAKSIAKGIENRGISSSCLAIGSVRPETLKECDLLVIGAPTQQFTASKPMKEFISRLEAEEGLDGKMFFAFDTKLPSRFSGSAAKYIESRLLRMGLHEIAERSSAVGRGSEFRLDEGELERFERLGEELGIALARH